MRVLIASLILFHSLSVKSQQINACTFNLRYDNPRDSGNLWKDRAPIVASLIRFHEFDILGTQEGLKHQLEDIRNSLPEYAYYGKGRDDGQSKGEHSAIFYRKDKYTVIDSGDFWLSQTPEKPGPGWDANLNRICSWVKLKTKQKGKTFYVFNVHYDHQGVKARVESSKLMVEKIRQIAGKQPVIFTGDFNGNHQSEWYLHLKNSQLLKDALDLSTAPYTNSGSFNGFGANNASKDIIDHIFLSSHFEVKKYGILTDTYHGKYPSDHFPIMAIVNFK